MKTLVAQGHDVRVVLTEGASKFVAEKTLETFSQNRVLSNNIWHDEHVGTDHIQWARWAEIVLVYGTTLHYLAKLRHGLADDFLSLQIMATKAPTLLAPAMNVEMWGHPVNQENVEALARMGFHFVGPCEGTLACGERGLGHIADINDINERLSQILHQRSGTPSLRLPLSSKFSGKSILLSLGAMRTQVDNVRYIENSSSGKMGLAVIQALLSRGARVTALVGHVDESVLKELQSLQISILNFSDISSYEKQLFNNYFNFDFFFSLAAVLDFECIPIKGKIERGEAQKLELQLRPTQDYVAWAARERKAGQRVIAFALESGSWDEASERALHKLHKKAADVIVLNRSGESGEGPGADTNQLRVIWPSGKSASSGEKPLSKFQLADWLLCEFENEWGRSLRGLTVLQQ